MKNRKILLIFLLAAVLALSLTLSACDALLDIFGGFGGHTTHDYATTWSADATHHWHKCKQCDAAIDKEEHDFGEWVIDEAPTVTEEGSRHRVCATCTYTATGTIDPLGEDHKHEYDQWVPDNANTHHKECICGERSTDASENHVFSQWVIDKEPTETEEGLRHRICTLCSYNDSETIDPLGNGHSHVYDKWVSDNDDTHHKECLCGEVSTDASTSHVYPNDWIIDRYATTTQEGAKHRNCTLCNHRQEDVIPRLQQVSGTVDLYAINDFHGTWDRMSQFSGYLTEQKARGNTLLINSGDMFQGSMESNSNFGALLAECMDDTGFDCFTFGNHEFDWGLDNLKRLAANSATPYLGANIYNWNASSKTWGSFASDLAKEYVVKELDNGLKVGIIGIIGKDQITSISSQLVQSIGFKDPKLVIPTLSNKLRNELGCNVVVVSAHTGQSTFLEDSSWDITQYADAVFCAHTHFAEQDTRNGVPFIQGGSNGRYVSHVTLEVASDGSVSYTVSENISYNSGWPNKVSVQQKINNSNASIADEASQELATLNGGKLTKSTGVGRLVSHAIANYATQQGHDIDLAMVNTGRADLQQGKITYTQLYEAVPFDNTVYIAKVSGADIINEAKYNYIWRVTGNAIENSSTKYYKIAVLDYLLYHQNSNRNYDYFKSAFTSGFTPVPLTKTGVDVYNYRLITRDFLLSQGTITNTTYTVDSNNTDTSLLQQAVTLSIASYAPTLVCIVPSKFTYCY